MMLITSNHNSTMSSAPDLTNIRSQLSQHIKQLDHHEENPLKSYSSEREHLQGLRNSRSLLAGKQPSSGTTMLNLAMTQRMGNK